jgi:hypothetical protein
MSACSSALPEWILKLVLSTSEFEDYMDATLQMAIDGSDRMFRCPNESCATVMERVEVDAGELSRSLSLSQSQSRVGVLHADCQHHLLVFHSRAQLTCCSCSRVAFTHATQTRV